MWGWPAEMFLLLNNGAVLLYLKFTHEMQLVPMAVAALHPAVGQGEK